MSAIWLAAATFAAISAPPAMQNLSPIHVGRIAYISDRAPANWAIGGVEIVRARASVGSLSPTTRTMAWDARAVEILSRTQEPPMRRSSVSTARANGRTFVVVRRYPLMEVTPEDAHEARTTVARLARRWAHRVGNALPRVAPYPSSH